MLLPPPVRRGFRPVAPGTPGETLVQQVWFGEGRNSQKRQREHPGSCQRPPGQDGLLEPIRAQARRQAHEDHHHPDSALAVDVAEGEGATAFL